MTTPSFARTNGLSHQQLLAVEHLLIGHNDTETAKDIGVARETVTRWRLYDAAFRDRLDERRRELWAGAVDAVRAILPQAALTMYGELRVGNHRGRLALDLLTRAGLLGKPYSGALGLVSSSSEDPDPDGTSGPDTAGATTSTEQPDAPDGPNALTAPDAPGAPESHSVTQDHASAGSGAPESHSVTQDHANAGSDAP